MKPILQFVVEGIFTVLLIFIIRVIVKREKTSENPWEKFFLRFLIILGHTAALGIIVLCIVAGGSYVGEGEVKEYIVLFLMAVLLALSQLYSIPRTYRRFRGENKR